MTAHGAYTKAMTAMRHVRGYGHDASQNIYALLAAGPLKEDPELVERINVLAEGFKALEAELYRLKTESYELAQAYLVKNAASVTRDYRITGGHASMRIRAKSKADQWGQ